MGSPTGDPNWAFYDILDCVHIMWACMNCLSWWKIMVNIPSSYNSKMVSTLRATQTYKAPDVILLHYQLVL